jgi:DNA primase
VEGEPDSPSASEVGLAAVAVPGASGWKPDFAPRIAAGRDRVVILPDADATGRQAAAKWAAELARLCHDVRIVDPHPDRTDGADLSDFLADADGDVERDGARRLLMEMADAAPQMKRRGWRDRRRRRHDP